MYIRKTLNGNTICTLGVNHTDTEISELCILPLNTALLPNFERMITINPFMKDPSKLRTKRIILRSNIDAWYEKLDLWYEQYIAKGQIIPLVYDWPLVSRLLSNMLGGDGALNYFFKDECVRDIKPVAQYMTDLTEWSDLNKLPFSKTTLKHICNNCDNELPYDSTTLDKAKAITASYRKMLSINTQGLRLTL